MLDQVFLSVRLCNITAIIPLHKRRYHLVTLPLVQANVIFAETTPTLGDSTSSTVYRQVGDGHKRGPLWDRPPRIIRAVKASRTDGRKPGPLWGCPPRTIPATQVSQILTQTGPLWDISFHRALCVHIYVVCIYVPSVGVYTLQRCL